MAAIFLEEAESIPQCTAAHLSSEHSRPHAPLNDPILQEASHSMFISHITLSLATEEDLPTVIDLQFRCFSQKVLIEQIANPDTPTNRALMLERHRQDLRTEPGLQLVKATVSTSNQSRPTITNDSPETSEENLVGFCFFYIPTLDPTPSNPNNVLLPKPLRPPPTATQLSTPIPTPDPPPTSTSTTQPTTSIALSQTNISTLLPYRHTLMTSLFAAGFSDANHPPRAGYVRYMCVEPAHRGRGIGRQLMEWGCALFDQEDVGVYLEATDEGEPLYRRYGWEKVGEQVLEVEGVVRARYACMWREKRGATLLE